MIPKLIQNEQTFEGVQVEGVVYWVDFTEHVTIKSGKKYVYSVRYKRPIVIGSVENSYTSECFEIIAQSSLVLEGIPVISMEVDVRVLREKSWEIQANSFSNINQGVNPYAYSLGFFDGHKSAQSDKKWSENDMFQIFLRGMGVMNIKEFKEMNTEDLFKVILYKLQPQIKEIHVDEQFRTFKIVEE